MLDFIRSNDIKSSTFYHDFNKGGFSQELKDSTNHLTGNASFRERIHCVINSINHIPKCEICGENDAIFGRTDEVVDGVRIRSHGYRTCSKVCTQIKRSNSVSITRKSVDKDYSMRMARTAVENYMEKNGRADFLKQLDEVYDRTTLNQCKYHKTDELTLCKCGKPARWLESHYEKRCSDCKKQLTIDNIEFIKAQNKRGDEIRKNAELKLVEGYDDLVLTSKDLFESRHHECGLDFSITRSLLNSRILKKVIICTECNPKHSSVSSSELKLGEFIRSIYDGNIITSTRNVIKPFELDIFLPELNLAFEFNGLYWHTTKFVERSYHLNKTKMCNELGIRLIHVWEHDWVDRQEIIKSIISQSVGSTNRLYARKLKMIEPSKSEVKEFLESNHLQGNLWFTKALALSYGSGIVQLITINSKKKYHEIGRLATKLNTSVVGGTKRLFKHVTKDLAGKLITYSDRSIFTGMVYESLGMKRLKPTEVGYLYFKNEVLSRHKCQKHKLIKMGYDENMTELEIMESRGYHRIYNCGNHKFEIDL